jgi:hypothetical protein
MGHTIEAPVRWYKRASDIQLFGIGPLFVTRWSNAVHISLLHDQHEAQVAHAKEHGRLAILAVIDHKGMPKVDNVNQEFRDTAQRYSIENQDRVHALAYVIPMDGFVGSIARSVVAGITMVLRQPFPTRAFKTADEGMAWLGAECTAKNIALDAGEAMRTLKQLREGVSEPA